MILARLPPRARYLICARSEAWCCARRGKGEISSGSEKRGYAPGRFTRSNITVSREKLIQMLLGPR
jgi:hypothetical protein